MQIISHRGLWKVRNEQNSEKAFLCSFNAGFGLETDIRDHCGQIVISHDMPNGYSLNIEKLFQIYQSANNNLPLAINIKSDGLQSKLKELLDKYHMTNYFVFDMSVPEAISYINHELKVYTRQSEHETIPSFYEHANGVWIDSFYKEWLTEGVINEHLDNGKEVCIVSPELHKRDHTEFWKRISGMKRIKDNRIMLCSDLPEQARKFFNEKN